LLPHADPLPWSWRFAKTDERSWGRSSRRSACPGVARGSTVCDTGQSPLLAVVGLAGLLLLLGVGQLLALGLAAREQVRLHGLEHVEDRLGRVALGGRRAVDVGEAGPDRVALLEEDLGPR